MSAEGEKEWNYDIVTGKYEFVSNKGGEEIDYVNLYADGEFLTTNERVVKHITITTQGGNEAPDKYWQDRSFGELRTSITKGRGGEIEPLEFSSPFFYGEA